VKPPCSLAIWSASTSASQSSVVIANIVRVISSGAERSPSTRHCEFRYSEPWQSHSILSSSRIRGSIWTYSSLRVSVLRTVAISLHPVILANAGIRLDVFVIASFGTPNRGNLTPSCHPRECGDPSGRIRHCEFRYSEPWQSRYDKQTHQNAPYLNKENFPVISFNSPVSPKRQIAQ